MKYLLAGGILGNNMPLWRKITRMGVGEKKYCNAAIIVNHSLLVEWGGKNKVEQMRMALAQLISRSDVRDAIVTHKIKIDLSFLNILESYYYLKDYTEFMTLIKQFGFFILDSGAFTFMKNRVSVDWDRYINEYANFINSYGIELFFELDIDSIVGIKETERLREKLYNLTGKKPIPVWHKSRGKQYFINMCKEYQYVAIGGIVTREIPRNIYEAAFPWFIRTAHEYGSKIHGLGYSSINGLKKYHFDSVDSTTWLSGNMSGKVFRFNGNGMDIIPAAKGRKLKSNAAALNNFCEWVKFSIYADKKL